MSNVTREVDLLRQLEQRDETIDKLETELHELRQNYGMLKIHSVHLARLLDSAEKAIADRDLKLLGRNPDGSLIKPEPFLQSE